MGTASNLNAPKGSVPIKRLKNTGLKFGMQIDIGHMRVTTAEISIFLKFKMAAAAIK